MRKHYTSWSTKGITITNISSTRDYTIHDPPLTEAGKKQAIAIRINYPFLSNPSAFLVSSPFRRTLQTSLIAFHQKPLPNPYLQENSNKPCDTGSPRSILEAEFPGLNFNLVVDGWDSKTGEWASDDETLDKRASKVREWLREYPEDEIIVVTHGGARSIV